MMPFFVSFIDRQAKGFGAAPVRRIRVHGRRETIACALRLRRVYTRLLFVMEGCEKLWKGGLDNRSRPLRCPDYPSRPWGHSSRRLWRHNVLPDTPMAQAVELSSLDWGCIANILFSRARLWNTPGPVQLQQIQQQLLPRCNYHQQRKLSDQLPGWICNLQCSRLHGPCSEQINRSSRWRRSGIGIHRVSTSNCNDGWLCVLVHHLLPDANHLGSGQYLRRPRSNDHRPVRRVSPGVGKKAGGFRTRAIDRNLSVRASHDDLCK